MLVESPMDCREMKPVNPKGNQSRIFIESTGAQAKTPILWSPDVNSWLIRKDPDAGKDWRQEEKGTTEEEMVVWYLRLNEQECEQALGFGDGQGSLACCSLWGHKESDMTEWLNWTELNQNNRNFLVISNDLSWLIFFFMACVDIPEVQKWPLRFSHQHSRGSPEKNLESKRVSKTCCCCC